MPRLHLNITGTLSLLDFGECGTSEPETVEYVLTRPRLEDGISTGWRFVRLIGQKRPCLVGNRFTRSLKRIGNRVHKFPPPPNPSSKIQNDCRQFSNLLRRSIQLNNVLSFSLCLSVKLIDAFASIRLRNQIFMHRHFGRQSVNLSSR